MAYSPVNNPNQLTAVAAGDELTIHDASATSNQVSAVRADVLMSSPRKTTTVTAAGPSSPDVSAGVSVVFVDTSSNNVTLGGLSGGQTGQVVHVVIIDGTNNTVIEHAEGDDENFFLVGAGDKTFTAAYGGVSVVFDGTDWHEMGRLI